MKYHPNIISRNCFVCDKSFNIRLVNNHKSNSQVVRKKISITCSHKCSKLYNRIYDKIRERIKGSNLTAKIDAETIRVLLDTRISQLVELMKFSESKINDKKYHKENLIDEGEIECDITDMDSRINELYNIRDTLFGEVLQ